MTPAARIEAAIALLQHIMDTPKPADGLVRAWFRDRRFIGSKDRAAVSDRVFRILRSQHRLHWWLEQERQTPCARLLVLADILLRGESPRSGLDVLFSGGTYAPPPLTKQEHAFAKVLDGQALDAPHMPLRERTECPAWAFDHLKDSLGATYENEMRSLLEPAPLDLRVNRLKATRDDVLNRLKADGFAVEAGRHSPDALRLLGRPAILAHPLYTDGTIEIQDEGSQMVALFTNARPGEQVMDFCAGAGGKTLALAAMMENKGRIVAMDVLDRRLEKAKLRFRRADAHNIETRALTPENDAWLKRQKKHFDCVLIDAPCTGLGTWRRAPDQRFRALGPSLSALTVLQREILERASPLVKPGGRLIYATCSLLAEENEKQIEAFLAAHSDFRDAGVLKMTPARDGTDGFFAARLERLA